MNPKLMLMDQLREVLRVRHCAIRTEQACCDWIKRHVHFHRMRSRDDLFPRTDKVELFLSGVAVRWRVSVAAQKQTE